MRKGRKKKSTREKQALKKKGKIAGPDERMGFLNS